MKLTEQTTQFNFVRGNISDNVVPTVKISKFLKEKKL